MTLVRLLDLGLVAAGIPRQQAAPIAMVFIAAVRLPATRWELMLPVFAVEE